MINERQFQLDQEEAVKLLTHYITLLMESNNRRVDSDVRAELRQLVYDMTEPTMEMIRQLDQRISALEALHGPDNFHGRDLH